MNQNDHYSQIDNVRMSAMLKQELDHFLVVHYAREYKSREAVFGLIVVDEKLNALLAKLVYLIVVFGAHTMQQLSHLQYFDWICCDGHLFLLRRYFVVVVVVIQYYRRR